MTQEQLEKGCDLKDEIEYHTQMISWIKQILAGDTGYSVEISGNDQEVSYNDDDMKQMGISAPCLTDLMITYHTNLIAHLQKQFDEL